MASEKKIRKKSYSGRAIILFLVGFMAVVGISVYSQMDKYNALKADEAEILESIEEEKERSVALKAEQEYYTSDAYIEGIARQQLGLIMPDERVFINRAEN